MGIYKSGRPRKYNPFAELGSAPPKKAGEYRMRNGDGLLSYIGETNNLNRRMKEHMRSGKLCEGHTFEFMIADGRSTSSTRRTHERKSILKHSPFLNRSKGGEGRRATK